MSSLIMRNTARANCTSSTFDRRASRVRKLSRTAIAMAPNKITVRLSARMSSNSVTPARRILIDFRMPRSLFLPSTDCRRAVANEQSPPRL